MSIPVSSSDFYTHHNFFYTADGFKEDYGGHDAIFHSNVVIPRAYDAQNCINCNNNFVPGHANVLTNNTCAVMSARRPQDFDLVIPANGDGGKSGGVSAVFCAAFWILRLLPLYNMYYPLPYFTFSISLTTCRLVQWARDRHNGGEQQSLVDCRILPVVSIL